MPRHQKIAIVTQQLRLPAVCNLCSQYHSGLFAICENCQGFLKPIREGCNYCARPLIASNFSICGHCIKKKPAFDGAYIAYHFEEPLRSLLHEFKYKEALYLRSFLARLMLDALKGQPLETECLIPVPLHPRRLQQRGFNQAGELAKLLGSHLNIPCELNICKKIIHTLPQAQLDKQQRHHNLHEAFQIKPTSYQRVTLVDDLLTTGNTLNALAKALKKQGVPVVTIWCCARAC